MSPSRICSRKAWCSKTAPRCPSPRATPSIRRRFDKYGADTARLFIMFAAPPEQSLEWSDAGVEGAYRFLKRLWKLAANHVEQGPAPALQPLLATLNPAQVELRRALHRTIAKVNDDMGRRFTFNTAIAAVMELTNALNKAEDNTPAGRAIMQEAVEAMVLMLSPIVPHITHALWKELGHTNAVVQAAWPVVDSAALKSDTIELVIQVNGKLRGRISVAAHADQAAVQASALADPNVMRFTDGKDVQKVVV